MNIIRYNKKEEYDAIPSTDLMDIVRVNARDNREIMDAWEGHFKAAGVPFAVEKLGKEEVLWKERRV